MDNPFAAFLRNMFHYDPETGVFRRRRGRGIGKIAGGLNGKGHRRIRVGTKKYYAGRLAVLYVTGQWPRSMIDHRNGDPDDNRLANLREASASQNAANIKRRRDNAEGFRGIRRNGNGWQAQIGYRGKNIALGTFPTKEEAHAVYVRAAVGTQAEFAAFLPDPLPARPGAPLYAPIVKLEPTINEIRNVLDYDPDTGIFVWRVDRSRTAKAGDTAGARHVHGYIVISVLGLRASAQRLAWALSYGEWPNYLIDHINGISDDNRLSNLRCATRAANARNSRGWAKRKSPLKGAYRAAKGARPWRSAIRVDRKLIHLGCFETAEDAHAAYMRAAREHFGEFARGS